MTRRESAPIGAPCWVDVFSTDPAKTQAFYSELFGWTVEDPGPDYGGYFNFLKDGVQVAGGMRNDGEAGVPDHWSVYLATADAEATTAAAVANGGQVIVPAMPVMELGSMAVMTDAGNASIGAWQPGLHKGFGILDEPGAPAWFELHTRDYKASVQFYETVFAWDAHTMSDATEFRYTTLGEGDGALAGIMDISEFVPEGTPAFWTVYFRVQDTDASLAKIVELGGSMLREPEDTPYGRLAEAADPTGAAFKLTTGRP